MSANLDQSPHHSIQRQVRAAVAAVRVAPSGPRRPGPVQGKQASPVNQVAPTAAVPVTERFTPIDRQDANFDRRWVFPLPYEHAQLVDKFDELQMLGDPKPSLVMNAANAMGRAKDDVILGAILRDRQDGRAGRGLRRLRHGADDCRRAERLGFAGRVGRDQPDRRQAPRSGEDLPAEQRRSRPRADHRRLECEGA
jgi:hypothetical protein